MKKPKHREDIERLISECHRRGVCDLNGDSVEAAGGRYIAKPRVRGVVKLHRIYRREDYRD